MTFSKLAPVCTASGDRLNSYGYAARKDADGRAPCPVCGKTVKLRKAGIDRHPNTIPHHHDERGFSRGQGSSYPTLPGRKVGKPATTVASAPVAGHQPYPAMPEPDVTHPGEQEDSYSRSAMAAAMRATHDRGYSVGWDHGKEHASAPVTGEAVRMEDLKAIAREVAADSAAIRAEAHNAALEKAAVIVETAPDYLQDSTFNGAARAIRTLKTQAGKPDFTDAYEGAREDLAIWKRRALEAERDLRAERETSSRLIAELNAQNGPTHKGEPAPQAGEAQAVALVEVSVPHLRSISVKIIPDAPMPNVGDLLYAAPQASEAVRNARAEGFLAGLDQALEVLEHDDFATRLQSAQVIRTLKSQSSALSAQPELSSGAPNGRKRTAAERRAPMVERVYGAGVTAQPEQKEGGSDA